MTPEAAAELRAAGFDPATSGGCVAVDADGQPCVRGTGAIGMALKARRQPAAFGQAAIDGRVANMPPLPARRETGPRGRPGAFLARLDDLGRWCDLYAQRQTAAEPVAGDVAPVVAPLVAPLPRSTSQPGTGGTVTPLHEAVPTAAEGDAVCGVPALARALGCSPRTVKRRIADGTLPVRRSAAQGGRAVWLPRAELLKLRRRLDGASAADDESEGP